MNKEKITEMIELGKTSLGIELGSTRIKAVLIGEDYKPIASGDYVWENRFEDGVWTYHLDDVWLGIQTCYSNLAENVFKSYGVKITTIGSIGFSAMMHGYLAFDKNGNQLAQFRTWRNTITEKAAAELTELFSFNIPQRWSIAHLYNAILNKENHTKDIAFLTTLAGYVHWQLTGEKVLGVGEASGMFPIDGQGCTYNKLMISKFNEKSNSLGFEQNLEDILPHVLNAGESAGALTERGAKLLDVSGNLCCGIPLCPPEGDAGTGMVATNSVAEHTGNVSAGTSIFAMVVLDKPVSAVYPEIDIVTTPAGKPVAMVHCNTCTSDLDAWVKLFSQLLKSYGCNVNKPKLYDMLYKQALSGDADCGNLISFNYYSGEPVAGTKEGRPLFVRMPDSVLSLPNFMRVQIFSTMATLRLGMDILFEKEHISLERLCGHGGLFKTKLVGQKLMAGAMNTPVVVMETAGEGGAWGIALLARFLVDNPDNDSLEDYLSNRVFKDNSGETAFPDINDVNSFNSFMERYKKGLAVEKSAIEALK